MRRPRVPESFASPTAKTNAVEGRLYIKFDYWGQVFFLTVGLPSDATHKYLGNGIGLRFDEHTREFRGVAMVMMPYDGPIELPIDARLTLLEQSPP